MSILALLSLGQTFAILSGGIDLSVGSLLALVSVVCAQQMKNFGIVEGITAGIKAGVSRVVGEISAGKLAEGYDMPFGNLTHISNLGQPEPPPKPAPKTNGGQ